MRGHNILCPTIILVKPSLEHCSMHLCTLFSAQLLLHIPMSQGMRSLQSEKDGKQTDNYSQTSMAQTLLEP